MRQRAGHGAKAGRSGATPRPAGPAHPDTTPRHRISHQTRWIDSVVAGVALAAIAIGLLLIGTGI